MPIRKEPLINGYYYHIFNKTYIHQPFLDERLCQRGLLSLWYGNYPHSISLSSYLHSSKEVQQRHLDIINREIPKITLLSHVFMPNHFHLLVRQNLDYGIPKFVSDFENTLTQYFNKKHSCSGPIFQTQFKAVRIKSKEHLLHVSRYIHLNPNTACITHNTNKLVNYPSSSLGIYTGNFENMHNNLNTSIILSSFHKPEDYLQFVLDNAEHQKTLHGLYKQYIDA